MKDSQHQKQKLLDRLEELAGRMRAIYDELESHNSRDWEELAVEREPDEVLEGMGLSAQEEIRAIQGALVRMEAGEYGICVTCAALIPNERLEILPYTPFCKTCAIDHEETR